MPVPVPVHAAPRRNARYTELDADGPLPWELLRALRAIRRDPLTFLEGLVARHGDLVAFPMPRGEAVLVNDPVGARRVLVDNARGYGKATVQYGALSMVTGAGLLTTDGEVWRRHRRVVQPAFHARSLAGVADAATMAAQRMRAEWDAAGPGGVVDADGAAMRAMLEVVGRTLFAADLRPVGEQVVGAVDTALHAVVRTASSPLPGWWPTRRRRRLRQAVATLDAVCADLVGRRRARGIGPDDADVLALLLAAVDAGETGAGGTDADGGLALTEVRDEILTLVIAGHETVASSLTWTLGLLAATPQVQRALHTELDAVLAGREPGWDDVPQLPYTRAVVDEALRLYPPAWVITRRALADDVIAGLAVPAGTLVILSPWLLHRRPQSWPDPLRFDPGRFLGDAPASRGPARGDYLPFGAGPRLCIGREMAIVESVLVLAALLRDRTVTRPDGVPAPAVDALVTLRPRPGLPLHLTAR